jgi:non-ribosomal peptide synthetase component F
MTLDGIVRRNAVRFPARTALVAGERVLTWSALDARINRAAAALIAAGLSPGDRVAILMGNRAEYFELYFACARAGAIAVPLNYRLTSTEAVQILNQADPSLFVVENAHGALGATTLQALAHTAGLVRRTDRNRTRRHCATSASAETMHAVDYDQVLAAAPTPAPVRRGDERDPFAIFYTSGTTGLPKARWDAPEPRNERPQPARGGREPPGRREPRCNAPLSHGCGVHGGHLHDARLHAGDPAAVHAGELACDTGTHSRIRIAADPDDDQRNPERA